MFYADTSVNGSASAPRCGLDFFARIMLLFGTDCPSIRRAARFSSRDHKTIDSLKLKETTGAKSISATPSAC